MAPRRTVISVLLVIFYVVASMIAIYEIFVKGDERATGIAIACILPMAIIALVLIRVSSSGTHVRADQSNRVLALASETVTHMREGLDNTSAQAVCELLLPAVNASAVAITDRENILGYTGMAASSYVPGTPIKTAVTLETLEDGVVRVVKLGKDNVMVGANPDIKGAIVVPLIVRDNIVGTLKFYYADANHLDEGQRAMAEGFGQLLSTQVALSYLEQQAELATRMELKALQAQINPHFLFNTINTIAAYTRTEPDKARKMLREFAVYYRRLLENSEDLIPLYAEIEQTDRYLMFQRARFGDDAIEMSVEIEEDLEDLPVPAFIVQPIVENAVGHARRPDGSTLHINVRAYRVSDSVMVEVRDDGVGIEAERLNNIVSGGSKTGMGIALKNVNARLMGYFGTLSGLHVYSEYGTGTMVCLTLYDAMQDDEDEPEV